MLKSLTERGGTPPLNGQNPLGIGIFVHFGPGLAGSFGALLVVGGLVGGCGARAVSRKTSIYFMIIKKSNKNMACQATNCV